MAVMKDIQELLKSNKSLQINFLIKKSTIMKSLTTILLCFLLNFTIWGSNSAVLTSEILTDKMWVGSDQEGCSVYYEFQEPSILDIIRNENGEITWTMAFWQLTHSNGKDFILIRQNMVRGHERFQIAAQSNELIFSNSNVEFVLRPVEKADHLNNIKRADIIGKWKSPFYNKKTGKIATGRTNTKHMWKTAFTFNNDGSFQRHIQLGTYVEAETGIWNLSEDGQFIKLHFAVDGDAENIYKREVLNIDNYKNENLKLSTEPANDKFLSEFELFKS